MPAAERRASLIAILSACGAFAIGMGLTLPLLSLILERRGFPGSVNGLNLATAGLAAFFVTPQVPRLMRTFGTATFMAGSLILSATALLALFQVQSLWAWFPLRFALSVGLNGLFVASEFWINQLANDSNRGRYISLYGACISGGFGVGPAILSVLGTHGVAPFAIGSAMLLLALVPVLIARKAAPQLDETPGPSTLAVLRMAPAILSAALVFGAIDAGMGGLFPVYAVRSGYTETHAALAITAMSIGSFVFQYPLGILADRMNRRTLLILCASTGVAGAILTPFAIATPILTYLLLFFWGGIIMGVYTIGLTLLGERFKGRDLASANATYVMLYAIGLLSGPMVEGVALDAWNPHGLMVVLALISVFYVIFLTVSRQTPAASAA
ncbi:MAG: MFS transporter [Rhizomicrobium sp.]